MATASWLGVVSPRFNHGLATTCVGGIRRGALPAQPIATARASGTSANKVARQGRRPHPFGLAVIAYSRASCDFWSLGNIDGSGAGQELGTSKVGSRVSN